jgi:small conductance mechanosensitive channel
MIFTEAWTKIQDKIAGLIAALPDIALALVVFVLFFYSAKGIKSTVERLTRTQVRTRNVGLVLGRLSQGLVTLLGLLVGLSIALPDFGAGKLIELLGIGSVAIGFAFRDIFQNFLAGILLLLTEPFGIGDQIVVHEFEGTVEDIQTRATLIKTYDGRRVVIPNADLFTESVIVNTAFAIRRSEYDVHIGYGDDIAQAKQLIVEAIKRADGVLQEPPPETLVMDLAPSSVQIRARWWTKSRRVEVLTGQDQVITAIKNTLVEHGIDLPFPTQQILFHDQTEETDGDRLRQREGWRAGTGAVPQPRSITGSLRKLVETHVRHDGGDHLRHTEEPV